MSTNPGGRVIDIYLAVAVGGAIGALCRQLMEVTFPTASGSWPMATFVVNISGALALGGVLAFADIRYPDPAVSRVARRFRPFVITGVLGGYTTFSTFMVESHSLILTGRWWLALVYLVGSILAGVVCFLIGLALGSTVVNKLRLAPSVGAAFERGVADVVDEDEA